MFRPFVGILREVHNKEYITKVFEPMHKCKAQETYYVYKVLVYVYMHLFVSLPYLIGLMRDRRLFKKSVRQFTISLCRKTNFTVLKYVH
jgi:hypothetical protein